MNWRIPLADLDYGPDEEQAVQDVLRSRWLTMGAVTQRFEQAFAAALNVPHAIAVSNATVALHLACLALGIGPGDEVIVPALTFVASANAVLYTGAEVRFAEVSGPADLNISPEAIAAAITPRTKAILVVHYAGYPCRMVAIRALAEQHGLALIEDAAHAPLATLDGCALGAWGDIGCFSFFSNKNLSTGEGGMLTTANDELAARLRTLRSHGMTSLTWDRHQGHAYSYDVTDLGYNYRIDEIRSALGLAQLAKLPAGNARRAALTRRYWAQLEALPVELPFREWEASDRVEPAYHIFPVLLPPQADRKAVIDALRERGIQTSIHYPPIHTFSYYRARYPGVSLPQTEAIAARQLTLPLYPAMPDAAVDEVVAALQAALAA